MDIFFDYTLRTVALGAAVLGLLSGALGAFALLRRQSLLGDAMAHAALPGICVAFLVTGARALPVLMVGAVGAALLATLIMTGIVRTTRLKVDAALGLVLSVFFGFGLLLLTFIQKLPTAAQAGLDRYLFGQAAALVERDVIVMAALATVALGIVGLLWKELKLLVFDAEFGATLGFPMRRLDILVVSLMAVAIVVGLQTVGVVLMTAMLVAPAAAARQWTERLSTMVVLSGLFGGISGIIGAVLSSTAERLPTGPTIVLTASVIVVISLLLAPARGLVWAELRRRRDRAALQRPADLATDGR